MGSDDIRLSKFNLDPPFVPGSAYHPFGKSGADLPHGLLGREIVDFDFHAPVLLQTFNQLRMLEFI